MDALAISLSHGLQYGVPLRSYVETFTGMRFEPAGMTDDPDIRIATSIMDYLARKLAVFYMTMDERAELGIFTTGERTQQTLPGVDDTPTVSGGDVALDPPSVESADELMTRIEAEAAAPKAAAPAPIAQAKPAPVTDHDAPLCMQCGVTMQRAGSCHACPDCGNTSGCS